MIYLWTLISFVFLFRLDFASGQELGDIRLRPSYQQTLHACLSDKNAFKVQIYEKAFVSGMNDFLEVAALSPKGFSAAIANKGVATFVVDFINTDTTWPALTECIPNQLERRRFWDLMNLSDGMGKATGLLISAASFRLVTSVSQGVFNTLRGISPILAQRAVVATAAAGSAYSLYIVQKRLRERHDTESNRKDGDLENDFKEKMRKTALGNKLKLQRLLEDPTLTESQRNTIAKEILNWDIVLASF